jgi:TupA-like ATPgrasp
MRPESLHGEHRGIGTMDLKELYLRLRPYIIPGPIRGYLRFVAGHRRLPRIRDPRTFSDKVIWKMWFDRRPILRMFSDKVSVRNYVRDQVGGEYLNTLYKVSNDPTQIPWTSIPTPYVVKASHGCGWNSFVMNRDEIDEEKLIRKCRAWLKRDYYDFKGEWSYRRAPRRILIESFLDAGNGKSPADYKFFVFGGRVEYVLVDLDRFGDHRKNFYTRDWKFVRSVKFGYDHSVAPLGRPQSFDEMVRVAERLGKPVDMVRVDLYELQGRVIFGELTNYPLAGARSFSPPSFDIELGSKWSLPDFGRHCSQ